MCADGSAAGIRKISSGRSSSLVADGVVEVMLLGQNVNSYGKTLEEPDDLCTAFTARSRRSKDLERIRFMTSHPKDLSDELIEVMAQSQKICKHLHLPVQSGSTRILKEDEPALYKGTLSWHWWRRSKQQFRIFP